MSEPKNEPGYRSLTEDEKSLFWRFKEYWQEKLGLQDWRLTHSRVSPKNVMAMMDKWDKVQRQAAVKIGAKWAEHEANPAGIERTAFHEMCHVLVYDLAQLAIDHGADADVVVAMEHRIINVFERITPPGVLPTTEKDSK